jgi:hypothetical protein
VRLVSALYLVVEDDGADAAVPEELEVALDGVLVGADAGGVAGVEGTVDVVWSDVLGVASFCSPVLSAGASLPEEGFILSE